MPDNQAIYDMLRDVHTAQISSASTLGRIEESITNINKDASEMKEKVDRHERAYTIGKFLGIPLMASFHVGLKSVLYKLGWH